MRLTVFLPVGFAIISSTFTTETANDANHPDEDTIKTMPKKVRARYQNPWPSWQGLPSPWQYIKWKLLLTKERNTAEELQRELPVIVPNFQPSIDSGMAVTWLGHATVLVQMDGFNVLTDPVFSDRCSPLPFIGPKRIRPAPCDVKDLPHIHAVVISHNHYDHLDLSTVRSLHARFGDQLHWLVPMGLGAWFRATGVSNVIELSWWESSVIVMSQDGYRKGELEIVFLPSQHWSVRNFFDKDTTLWGSWAVISDQHRFFFAGDTGYCPEFTKIGFHYGPFNISAIPIGCYKPYYALRNQHVGPEDAVKIHKDVRSRYSIGIHWGTFEMGAIEAPLAPKYDLIEELRKAGLPPNEFFTLNHGETWSLPND